MKFPEKLSNKTPVSACDIEINRRREEFSDNNEHAKDLKKLEVNLSYLEDLLLKETHDLGVMVSDLNESNKSIKIQKDVIAKLETSITETEKNIRIKKLEIKNYVDESIEGLKKYN